MLSQQRVPHNFMPEAPYQAVELDEFALADDQSELDRRLRHRAPPSTPRELRNQAKDAGDESLSDVLTLRENLNRIDKTMVKEYSVGSVSALPISDEQWEMVYYVSKQHGPIDPNRIAEVLSRATKIRNISVFYDSMAQTIKVHVHSKDLVIYRHQWSDLVFNYVTLLVGVFVIGAFLL